ncbi:hypothetical protein QN277_015731 [Acacia crassicarpa]|uniref:Uncharacterized protein n=1 Tax=Acacia crassicarpa TaxID=499986 RepID=A0AAE1KKP3_9FABA|nr:hypothetical protein QN277_015731 [Acacia crassicarpa]
MGTKNSKRKYSSLTVERDGFNKCKPHAPSKMVGNLPLLKMGGIPAPKRLSLYENDLLKGLSRKFGSLPLFVILFHCSQRMPLAFKFTLKSYSQRLIDHSVKSRSYFFMQ